MKIYSTSLIIRGMQTKTIMRYHLSLIEFCILKKKVGEDVERRENLPNGQ